MFSDTALGQRLRMGLTMLNTVVNHLDVMATDQSVDKEMEEC